MTILPEVLLLQNQWDELQAQTNRIEAQNATLRAREASLTHLSQQTQQGQARFQENVIDKLPNIQAQLNRVGELERLVNDHVGGKQQAKSLSQEENKSSMANSIAFPGLGCDDDEQPQQQQFKSLLDKKQDDGGEHSEEMVAAYLDTLPPTDDDDERPTESFEKQESSGRRRSSVIQQIWNASNNTILKMMKPQSLETECALSEDVYSLMYIAPYFSSTFLYSIFVFFFQFALYIMVLIDQVDVSNPENPLDIPPSVPPQVAVAQFFGMFLAVACAQDLVQAITTFHAGFDAKLNQDVAPHASYVKFCLANGLQLVIGLSLLVNTFILIMQSPFVIDLFLNFAGLEFISLIDDVGFGLAKAGFVTKSLQTMCDVTQQVKQPLVNNLIFRRICYFFFSCGLVAGYAVILSKQMHGDYICQKIFVMFGDEFRSEYARFSGEYIQQNGYINDRVWYLEEKSIGRTDQHSILAYCVEETAWTHSVYKVGETPDPCNWGTRSPDTLTYDITETGKWLVYSVVTQTIYPLDLFFMSCNDCTGGDRGTCHELHGQCVNNQCVCNKGRYGLNCVFEEPCDDLRLRATQDPLPLDAMFEKFAQDYQLLRDWQRNAFLHYKHPVWIHYFEDDGRFHLIMFMARRWIITTNEYLRIPNGADPEELMEFLNNFHAVFTDYAFSFVSDGMDVSTPTYQGTPIDMPWYKVRHEGFNQTFFEEIETGPRLDTTFLCHLCSESNPCLNENECISNENDWNYGQCECLYGYYGSLCEAFLPCGPDAPCQNGGNCNAADGTCVCPGIETGSERYNGVYCERDRFPDVDSAWFAASQTWHNMTHLCGCRNTLQVEYRGDISVTNNGSECSAWNSNGSTWVYNGVNFPNSGYGDGELDGTVNACRNGIADDNVAYCVDHGPNWWARCAVPFCPEEVCPNLHETCDCTAASILLEQNPDWSRADWNITLPPYQGFINVTKSGRTCQRWDSHTPHAHPEVTTEQYPGLDENYCRNPGRALEGPWCYTTDPDVLFELCDIPQCPSRICSEWGYRNDTFTWNLEWEDYLAVTFDDDEGLLEESVVNGTNNTLEADDDAAAAVSPATNGTNVNETAAETATDDGDGLGLGGGNETTTTAAVVEEANNNSTNIGTTTVW